MVEEFHPSHMAFIIGALLTTFLGLGLSFFLTHVLKSRLGNTKPYLGPILIGHMFAYTLFLFSWKVEGINDGMMRAGLIAISVIPAFIFASSMGRPLTAAAGDAATDAVDEGDNGDAGNPPESDNEVKTPDATPVEKPPTFSEGLMKGVWAFISIWGFYILYITFFTLVAKLLDVILQQGQ